MLWTVTGEKSGNRKDETWKRKRVIKYKIERWINKTASRWVWDRTISHQRRILNIKGSSSLRNGQSQVSKKSGIAWVNNSN